MESSSRGGPRPHCAPYAAARTNRSDSHSLRCRPSQYPGASRSAVSSHYRDTIAIRLPHREAFKQVWAMLLRAFPDVHVTVEDLIAEGDKVVSRSVVTGTHKGEFMGLAPTGKSVTYNEIFIVRFVKGRIAEAWGVVDIFSLRQQLGVAPA
ncbi:ester cyclase [Nocardia sp. GCM10030253]|uniref:ester cyclase n=1 Tax=Nocardia sp. GCM10030253 TaxID=3273404 RepID=UPI00363AC9E7